MSILDTIVAHKKTEVAAARRLVSLAEIRRRAADCGPRRGFFRSLAARNPAGANVIAEIKRASPSKGLICADLDPGLQAQAYARGGAAALSVLTDQRFFQGTPQDLQNAREAVGLPVLRKDFTIDPYQVYESMVMGADAVLLIVRILSPALLCELIDLCRELGVDALVEVHSREDLDTAQQAGAALIGINNRDLSSFETHIGVSAHMASFLRDGQVAVAASGIQGAEDIRHLAGAGIYNFLIGESLVRAKDPQGFLETLIAAGALA